jgi:hypothetical protein
MYNYEEQKKEIFTEHGMVVYTSIRDNLRVLFDKAGAARFGNAIRGISGDVWTMMACVDRMVELKEIREVTQPNSCNGQDRIFERISL